MLRNLMIAAFVLLAIVVGHAQYLTNLHYATSFGDLSNATYNSEVASKSLMEGNYWYHVTYTSGTPTGNFLLVKKQHLDGTPAWEKTYGDLGAITFHHGIDLAVDGSGNVYVAGATAHSTEGYNALLVKYNSSGVQQWDYSYNNSGASDEYGLTLDLDASGNCYLAGQVDNAGLKDAFLLKVSSAGSLVWAQTYDYDGQEDGAVQLNYQDANTIEVMAITQGDGFIEELSKLVYNSSGILQSAQRSSIGVDNLQLQDLKRLSTGSYVACGAVPNALSGDDDLAVYQFASNMTTTWSYVHDENGFNDVANALTVDGSGNVLVSATVGLLAGKTSAQSIKLNSLGLEQWSKTFEYLVHYNTQGIRNALYAGDKYITLGTKEEDNGDVLSFLTLRSLSDGALEWYWQGAKKQTLQSNFLEVGAANEVLFTTIEDHAGTVAARAWSLELYKRNQTFVAEAPDKSEHVDDQLLIKWLPSALNTGTIDNTDLLFGSVDDFLTPAAVASLESYFGASIDFDMVTVSKIFRNATTACTTSVSRQGRVKEVPKFWTALRFDFNATVDEVALLSDFDFDNLSIVTHSSLNYKVEDRFTPNDPDFTQEQATLTIARNISAHIHAEDAWDFQRGRDFVRVGIVDRVVDWSHEDFQVTGNGRFADSKIDGGWDWASNQALSNITSIPVSLGHGTNVAGIVGALSNNATGVAGVAGGNMNANVLNPGASLFSFGRSDKEADVADMIVEAATSDPGNATRPGYAVHIMNCSWGYDDVNEVEEMPLLTEAFRYAKDQGVVMVCAAANKSAALESFPDSYNDDWVLKVSSSDNNSELTPTISGQVGGAWGHGLDVLAPGVKQMHYVLDPGDAYDVYDDAGTSYATPLVAGVAALMLGEHNQSTAHSSNLFPEDVEWIIEQSAQDLDYKPQDGIGTGYDEFTGWGKTRADYALSMLQTPNFKLQHVFRESTTETKIGDDVELTATDWYYLDEGNTKCLVKDKVYKVDIYEVEINVSIPWPGDSYQLLSTSNVSGASSTFQIFETGFWALNSSSNLWWYDAVNKTIAPYKDLHFTVAPHKDGSNLKATVKGHIFYVEKRKGALGGINEWMPHSNNDAHHLDFSVMFTKGWNLGLETSQLPQVHVFPNPAKGAFTLLNQSQAPLTQVAVYDLLGRHSLAVADVAAGQSLQVGVADLRAGMYLVKYLQNGQWQTQKMRIE